MPDQMRTTSAAATCGLEILVLFVLVINQDGMSARLFAVFDKRFEDGLARLDVEKFNHAGKDIDILVRLTSFATSRMNSDG